MACYFNRFRTALLDASLALSLSGAAMAQTPGMPASPLAGGAAAATGQQSFMDAAGNPIVMPASYGEPCYGGYGEACPPGYGGAGGYPYADFGGYSIPDQCGPHYFDIAVETVALSNEDLFKDVPQLASVGVGDAAPRIIDPNADFDDYEVGWQIAARLDVGPLSVLEATYMGIYDLGFVDQRVSSTEVTRLINQGVIPFIPEADRGFLLNSVFSDYGLFPIDGLDVADVYTLEYQSDLQSTELSYRRYWVGHSPRVSGTYLAGFRYIRMTEDLNFNALTMLGASNIRWSTDNDVLGAQVGGDGWIALRQGLRAGIETKAGVYNNHYKFEHDTLVPGVNRQPFFAEDDQIACVGEMSMDMVADILPSFSIRGGYRVLYMSSLVTVGNNINPNEFDDNATDEFVFNQADAIYHGFHAGLEYIW